MAILFALGLLLCGIGFLVLEVVTLFFLIAPVGLALMIGYGIWRVVTALRAVEKERAAARARTEGESNE